MKVFIGGDTEDGPIVDMADMVVGDVGIVVESTFGYEGEIVLVTYNKIVSLSNPIHTWEFFIDGRRNTNKVRLFPAGTILTVFV